MRKYFLFTIIFFSLTSQIFPQSDNLNVFTDISVYDSIFVWSVTYNGNLWHSSNGGSSWEIDSTGINHVWKIHFTNSSNGYLMADDNIYFSSDAGENWILSLEPEAFNFRDISFINDSVGFAVGFDLDSSKVFKTTNSGLNWSVVFDSANASLGTSLGVINILDEQNVWLLRTNVLYKTTNLGETWETIFYSNISVGFGFLKLIMFNESTGLLGSNFDAIVSEGRLLETTDGGYSWEIFPSPTFHFGITDFFFASHDIGWVADWNQDILFTSNRGTTWDSLQNYSTLPGAITKFAFIDELRGWAITRSYILYTIDGWQTFTIPGSISSIDDQYLQSPLNFTLYQNYPNPFNPRTTITYQVPEISFVSIKVYDVLGNEIASLVKEEKPLGSYEIEFNGTGLPSGIYFYRIQAGSFAESNKMVLMK